MGKGLKAKTEIKSPSQYRGIHLEKYRTEKDRREDREHPIFLFTPACFEDMEFYENRLDQIVHVEKHNMADFEFNSLDIIDHYRTYYGNQEFGLYTLGQSIKFTVYKGQKEPFELPLFKFLMNYTMLVLPIEVGCDMRLWKPWIPSRWTSDGWVDQLNKYIHDARPLANMRKICECLALSKYLMNMWVAQAGDRIGLSISNNDFIEVMKRSKDAYESITCTFDIPENISPTDLEKMTMDRTQRLLGFISDQIDLPISVYARNKLFNPTQFREYAVHICHKPDLSGNTIPYTYPTNIIMGIKDLRAFSVDAHGGRKAEITKLNVSDAGTLERALMMMMANVSHVDINYECNSRHFRKRYISRATDLVNLDGRVYTMDPKSDEFWILDPRDTDLVGKTIYMKTPITCTHPRRNEGYICSACYGKLMANLNCDIHIGKIAAAESADEIEQKLLSAKHALRTDTVRVEFDDTFYQFFELGNGQISLNSDMVEESMEGESNFAHLYLEFYPSTMGKSQDGESRHFDRSFREIVVYDDRDDTRITISEKNGALLYLSPEFNSDHFLPAMHYKDAQDVIQIPFRDLCDGGEIITPVLFEFSYKNHELASPLLTLDKIMFNCNEVNSFANYDECLDTLIPLFVKGGIYIPDYQTEMLVSQMITQPNGKPVDWNDPHPEYVFNSVNKSIRRSSSALTSILYREAGAQIAGAFDTYDKSGTSGYDWFILERGDKSND